MQNRFSNTIIQREVFWNPQFFPYRVLLKPGTATMWHTVNQAVHTLLCPCVCVCGNPVQISSKLLPQAETESLLCNNKEPCCDTGSAFSSLRGLIAGSGEAKPEKKKTSDVRLKQRVHA